MTKKTRVIILYFLISFSSLIFIVSDSIFLKSFSNVYGFFHSQVQENFITYENSKLKLSINYPYDWQKEERIGGLVSFLAPRESDSQTRFPAGLGISYSLLDSNTSLSVISTVHINNITSNLKDFRLLDTIKVKLGNKFDAYEIIFEALDGNELRKASQFITKNNNIAYLFTYKADLDKYDLYKPTIWKILDSLKFHK
ncbi:MAG: PsbP-related protein [Nitrososphaeraceae archaeon]